VALRKDRSTGDVNDILKRYYRNQFDDGITKSPSQQSLSHEMLDRSNSQTLKNYSALKKAGFDMKGHRVANFLCQSDDDDDSADEKGEVTMEEPEAVLKTPVKHLSQISKHDIPISIQKKAESASVTPARNVKPRNFRKACISSTFQKLLDDANNKIDGALFDK
jgi:hypothetical protein